jgi:excinuclease ABC subunit B
MGIPPTVSSSGATRSSAFSRSTPLTGQTLLQHRYIDIFPAKHFITPQEKLSKAIEDIEAELEQELVRLRNEEKLLEAQRLEQRTRYDMEMLREVGYCSGIENYSGICPNGRPGPRPGRCSTISPTIT